MERFLDDVVYLWVRGSTLCRVGHQHQNCVNVRIHEDDDRFYHMRSLPRINCCEIHISLACRIASMSLRSQSTPYVTEAPGYDEWRMLPKFGTQPMEYRKEIRVNVSVKRSLRIHKTSYWHHHCTLAHHRHFDTTRHFFRGGLRQRQRQ